MKVIIFTDNVSEKLQERINNWLKERNGQIKVKDIEYAASSEQKFVNEFEYKIVIPLFSAMITYADVEV